MRPIQVDPNYTTMAYLSRERWISFWYQIMEVMTRSPHSVLEVGLGSGIVSRTLRDLGVLVTTVDFDYRLRPTIVGDITALPIQSKSVDVVLVAEVLEHISFQEASLALRGLAQIMAKRIVITLPHFSRFAPSIALKIFPFVPRIQKVFPISVFPPTHHFDGQHYWEIGKSGYSLARVRQMLTGSTRMALVRDYVIEENPFHHMFVLESQ